MNKKMNNRLDNCIQVWVLGFMSIKFCDFPKLQKIEKFNTLKITV